MPIGGFVIQFDTSVREEVRGQLGAMAEVELHGDDKEGNMVAVLECATSQRMEEVVEAIGAVSGVRTVGLVYVHAEDEVDRIAGGEYIPSRRTNRPDR